MTSSSSSPRKPTQVQTSRMARPVKIRRSQEERTEETRSKLIEAAVEDTDLPIVVHLDHGADFGFQPINGSVHPPFGGRCVLPLQNGSIRLDNDHILRCNCFICN